MKSDEILKRYEKVIELRKKGLTLNEIGILLNVSKQRIHRMLDYYKKTVLDKPQF